ncbi:type II toxin-antitoxin system death-on-curing family toxin [Tenacibaculum finnmarkense]|uniref:type II toxin-antitoxin system death-on-curing family toxin n=1 Tax=Tenacibaculum finnmarkense TaxID=2781243 RepID=UPI001E606C79|nr:type II toxin-antitoxin system death-on-curing family toxin [Tenacibaculum finnmarkense]MCD8421703.1 type II toxin-antitoxin system death-on-curing family toxin [Tenacibaculum finnmarkense genomovar ulcerans]MCG8237829.1 type II toxin-antitoxin system death-on-curing family toxin [Tenacibaculum finnmarkense genomovar ulcerans]
MEDFLYFDVNHAIKIHDEIVKTSGGLLGLRDIGLLESTLYHMQNDIYYASIVDKLTHLLFSINKNHCFNDGNKRASLALCLYFLIINGLDFTIEKFTTEMENIVVDVADNRIDKNLLFEIIKSILYDEDYPEELKLKIYNAKR